MDINIQKNDSVSGHIITITYDRQEKLNALSSLGIKKLTESLQTIAHDSETRAVVFTGAGSKSFIGGADINELSNLNEVTAREFITSLHELFVLIRHCPVPVIARINGYCLGAGMELAAACDIRVASNNAIFGMPEVKVGIPSVIEAALLPRLVGWGRANYLVLTGENIDADTAYNWGFLERLVAESSLDKEVSRITDTISISGAIAIRAQKKLVHDWANLPFEEGIEAGIESLADAYATDEPKLMMQKFINRNK